jgi:hypothetical protein
MWGAITEDVSGSVLDGAGTRAKDVPLGVAGS